MSHNPGTGPTLVPQAPHLRWRGNRDADYKECKHRAYYNLGTNVAYDMNWGRSMLSPYGVSLYPKVPLDVVQYEDIPSVPFAHARESTYRRAPWDPSHVTAYDSALNTPW